MTSLDGGDPDPVRGRPPEDPWLTEAHTSVVGDATSMRGFSEVPPDDPAPYNPAPYNPAPVPDDRPRRHRAGPLLIAAHIAGVLAIVALLAINAFEPGEDSDSRGADPSAGTAAAPATSVVPAVVRDVEVVYEVTASGEDNTGSVSYLDEDGDIIRRNGIPLPWRTTFRAGEERRPLVLIAQRKDGGDAGPVTCTITVAGKVLATTTADGRYASPQCSGSG
ncbi:MmpS family transport accessory protein [Actinoplanes sp. NPDC051861]|uniref:MmpS family transport accessory protein n=1 Tax=Actinoplanes sp. NPDC051861 TaxID=3155170 RepID=UPI00344AA239